MENQNENTELQENETTVTIQETETAIPEQVVSNDTESGDAQGKIIEQQQSTIDALLARTEQLTKQLNMLVAQGVQITDETPSAIQEPEPDHEPFVSFADLGKDFGKR